MKVKFHPHARERMAERGADEEEVVATVLAGETVPAKFGRSAFRRNFKKAGVWRGRPFTAKQLEVIAVRESDGWLVITVVVRYF